MARRLPLLFVMLTGLLVLAGSGCSSLPSLKRSSIKQATTTNPAVRCLCVWQEGAGPGVNGESARGFGGQLFFFPREGEVPVAVQGDLKIFVFDDVGTEEEQAKPIYQLEVPSYELTARLGETQFGASYSIFVPYTRKGSHEANCALRVKLTRPDGSLLYSDMTQVKLSGTPRKKSIAPAEDEGQPVARTKASSADDERTTGETIAVERDGRMQRVETARMRYLGDASPTSELLGEDPQDKIREYEEKLRALKSSLKTESPRVRLEYQTGTLSR